MRAILYEQRRSSILAAGITILLGLLLLFWPDHSVNLMCMLLGAAILTTGLVYVLGWLGRRKAGVPAFYVLPGLILCALGMWLLTKPESVVRLVQYIFGGVLIFHGVVDLQGAAVLARQRYPRWTAGLLLAVLTTGLGALILVNPFGTFAALTMLIGASLVFDGVSDLVLIGRLSGAFKEARGAERPPEGGEQPPESK